MYRIKKRMNQMADYPKDCGAGEDMKVDGKIGIGTSSPSERLEIKSGSGGVTVELETTASYDAGMNFKVPNYQYNEFRLRNSNGRFDVRIGGADRLSIEQGGDVGIGTTNPTAKLEVDGGDAKISDNGKGIILKSPNGTVVRRLYLKDDGTLGLTSP